MKKKYFTILLASFVATVSLTACAEKHEKLGEWEVDVNEHWKGCSLCDEKFDEAEHTFNEEGACTVCGSEVYDFGDFKMLYLYTEKGDFLKSAEYDLDGNVITETDYKYEYGFNGNITRVQIYTDDVLIEEDLYKSVDGEDVLHECIYYNEDGTKFTNEYDDFGNIVKVLSYTADGEIDVDSTSEYSLDEYGEWYESKNVSIYSSGIKTESEYDRFGENITNIVYNAEGEIESSLAWDTEYNEDGDIISQKQYSDGVLISESVYKKLELEDGEGYVNFPETVTEYGEDGGRTVTVYDENDEVVSLTVYDADGNVISE